MAVQSAPQRHRVLAAGVRFIAAAATYGGGCLAVIVLESYLLLNAEGMAIRRWPWYAFQALPFAILAVAVGTGYITMRGVLAAFATSALVTGLLYRALDEGEYWATAWNLDFVPILSSCVVLVLLAYTRKMTR